MNELISNFRLSNKVFALILSEEKLVQKEDYLLEVCCPLSTSVSFNLKGHSSYVTTDPDEKFYNHVKFNKDRKSNFLYNGEICEDVKSAVLNLIDYSSFNIGICSNNSKEYELLRDKYHMFKEELEANLGLELEEIDKTLDDYKTYMLSYRRK